ncbi:sugar 3,4-ketoisomerase [Segatella baroniae]|uniref:WxcM-like protein n=1 Tax=Segatella baroniae F0067 TaxID=1115809 RepID=U2QAB3_9BACT|nr:FdtA/QdtA family cupin domain-containing protein [Segatella baroniae]ERK38268.1 WxcM-like protein [Segatella baroniae F0067]
MTSPLGEIITLPRITDPRGNLTVAEQLRHIPFEIKRVYWTYDVPAGESRGGHAHRHCRSVVIAVSGSFDVVLDNGKERRTYHMNHPYQALLINTGIWRTLEDFSSGAVCLSLASDEFEEEDYIRDYEAFLTYLKCSK